MPGCPLPGAGPRPAGSPEPCRAPASAIGTNLGGAAIGLARARVGHLEPAPAASTRACGTLGRNAASASMPPPGGVAGRSGQEGTMGDRAERCARAPDAPAGAGGRRGRGEPCPEGPSGRLRSLGTALPKGAARTGRLPPGLRERRPLRYGEAPRPWSRIARPEGRCLRQRRAPPCLVVQLWAQQGGEVESRPRGRRSLRPPCRRRARRRLPDPAFAAIKTSFASGRSVAQPGSASVWGTGGPGFKSRRSDQPSCIPSAPVPARSLPVAGSIGRRRPCPAAARTLGARGGQMRTDGTALDPSPCRDEAGKSASRASAACRPSLIYLRL